MDEQLDTALIAARAAARWIGELVTAFLGALAISDLPSPEV